MTEPVIGVGYRFFVDTGSAIKQYGDTKVQTNKVTNLGAIEDRYVTVTGTFRDGSEQVLLMQKGTIPAIADAVNQKFDYTYVRVLTFTNTSGIPGHGLLVKIINESASKVHSITLHGITDSSGKTQKDITISTSHQSGNDYFFYVPTATAVHDTPYPNLGTYWNTLALSCNATVVVQLKDSKETKNDVVENVVIPARKNFFRNDSIASGTLAKTSRSDKVANLTLETLTIDGAEQIVYGLKEQYQELGRIKKNEKKIEKDGVYELGNENKGTTEYLKTHGSDTLEAYVQVKEGSIPVWYLVADIPVSELIS